MRKNMDIIIFGATGFTGKHTVGILHKIIKNEGLNLTWGIAGRSETKLKKVLFDLEKEASDETVSNIPFIIADISDDKSLEAMTSQTKIIINCCGPYRFMGEAVIKSCVKTGTHHVDVSGEPQFMERMQLEYNDKAKEKEIYIVSACGMDSIPSDLGLLFLQKHFSGIINSVETYFTFGDDKPSQPGSSVNFGTWESAVYGLAHANELRDLRRKLFPSRMPKMNPVLKINQLPHKKDSVEGWILPFLGADRSVMLRTQRYLYEKKNQRPTQVQTYFTVPNFWNVLIFGLFGAIFSFLTKFEFGRNLLLNYPEFFSAGIFSKKEPSEEKIKNCWFKLTLHAKGWDEALANPNDQYTTPPNKEMVAEVRGQNPGYGATCICLVLSAITILTEKDKLPKEGGVYTPGSIFADTSLVDQLNKNDVTFKIVQNNKL